MVAQANDRFRGCLVGLALGDALGAPYEFQSAPEPDGAFHRGTFGTAPGHPTDDTMLAIALAESLVACGELDGPDFGRRLVAWLNTNPPDIGNQCRAAARSWARGEPPSPDPDAQGNGSLMAVAPIGLLFEPEAAHGNGARFSSFMHPSATSEDTCAAFSRLVSEHVRGEPPAPTTADAPVAAPNGERRGWCVLTLHLARHALDESRRKEPVEVLLDLIRLGGETDTNAAVAGALLGAAHGLGAWPTGLVEQLAAAERMVELADELHELARPST
jgi:ADP-ribosylglycohydrolase